MGILDDAIREHLELKRRRGAEPAEIERLEREALGPVRRGPEPSDALLEDQPPTGGAYATTAWPEEADEHPAAVSEFEDWEQDEPMTHESREGDWEEEEGEHAGPEAEWTGPGEELSPAPEPVAPPPVATPPPAPAPGSGADEPAGGHEAGGQTVEYDVEAEHEGKEQRSEDVLEETPEFLQDTPDHDRLWFEQRPPRDFDFDG